MTHFVAVITALLTLLMTGTAAAQPAERRVALLIGNAAYTHERKLRNPVSDATLLGRVLKDDLKFDTVRVERNLDVNDMDRVIDDFVRQSRGATTVVFYYSGHGITAPADRRSYLLPIDARTGVPGAPRLERQAVSADGVRDRLRSLGARVTLLILDACRDGPGDGKTGTKGLARVGGGNGLLVAYATDEGRVADDGSGSNSPYADALAQAWRQPQLTVLQQLDYVYDEVSRRVPGQEPMREGNLRANVWLASPFGAATPQVEDDAWARCKAASGRGPCDDYLGGWPGGRYVTLAQARLRELQTPAPIPTPAPNQTPAPALPGASRLLVRIGHVGPTSGPIAQLGKDNENGARLAIEELNARAVTIGGRRAEFELVAQDDSADPKQGVAAAQKLVDSKVNGVVGHLNSGTTIPASKVYSDAGIPQISPSASNPKYTRMGHKTAFRVVTDDVGLGVALGKYAVTQLKGKSIVVIDDRTAYGQGTADAFETGVRAAGGTTLWREFTSDKATDFATILNRAKAKNPDIVFFGGMDTVAGPMLRQMSQLGINAKFVGSDGICSSELPKLSANTMANGQVICAEGGGVESKDAATMVAFKAKFKTKFNVDVQVYAPYAYDAVNVMVAAMVKAGSADPAKYLPVLAATENLKGVTGPISFDDKGDLKNGALTVFTYRAGKREMLGVVR